MFLMLTNRCDGCACTSRQTRQKKQRKENNNNNEGYLGDSHYSRLMEDYQSDVASLHASSQDGAAEAGRWRPQRLCRAPQLAVGY